MNIKLTKARMWDVRLIWILHFSLGLVVLFVGVKKNNGRKFIQASSSECSKLFVNVYESSSIEKHEMICCDHSHNISLLHALSSKSSEWLCFMRAHSLPLSSSIKPSPISWVMPLIPAFLRLMIATLGKLGLISTINCTNTIKTTIQRIIFYVGMFLFRFVGLYLFLDKMEGLILASDAMQSPPFANCWYTSFLREEKRGEKCYGQEFDYSDHVVYFFAHIQTSMLFEFLFCFLVPIWPVNSRQPDYVSNKKITTTTKFSIGKIVPFYLKGVLQTVLSLVFLYLYGISLLEVHSTATYFHKTSESIIGYIISLFIQVPFALIMCSEKWTKVRRFVGLPNLSVHEN